MRTIHRRIGVLLALLLLLAACGNGDDGDDGAADGDDAAADSDDGDDAAPADGDPIKVGVVLSLSGPAASFGEPEANAAEVVAKKINDEGGINGRPLEVIIEDEQTDPTESARLTQSLVDQGVVAIIGSTIGSGTLAMAPVAAANEVPIFAPNATIGVTDPEADFAGWVFRIAPSDELLLPQVFQRVVDDGHEEVGIYYQEDAYGEFGTDLMEELAAEEGGLEIVETVNSPTDATDLSAQATRLRNAEPDAVIMNISSIGLAATMARATDSAGLDVPLYGGIGVGQDVLIELAGDAAEGVIVPNVAVTADLTEQQQELVDLLEAGGYSFAGGFADVAGAAGMVTIKTAIEKIDGEVTGASVRDAIGSGITVEDAYLHAPINYSDDQLDGFGADTLIWTEVQDGEWVEID